MLTLDDLTCFRRQTRTTSMVWQQQQRGVHESSPRSMLVVQYVIYFNFLKVAAQALDCDTTEADGLTDERKGVCMYLLLLCSIF